VILAVGFGGGVMLVNSTLKDEAPQKRAVIEPPFRVILPASAEAAPQPIPSAPPPETQSGKQQQTQVAQKQSENDKQVEERASR
jgi:hypothetical protein